MLLQTILNHVQPCKSFCYQTASFESDGKRIVVKMRPRKNGRAICSGCQAKCPGYDRLKERRYEFVPLWNIPQRHKLITPLLEPIVAGTLRLAARANRPSILTRAHFDDDALAVALEARRLVAKRLARLDRK